MKIVKAERPVFQGDLMILRVAALPPDQQTDVTDVVDVMKVSRDCGSYVDVRPAAEKF